jgi:hypothetical protein
MADNKPTKQQIGALIRAGIFEGLCCVAGVVAWAATNNWIWVVAGVLAGFGFSIPAIITFIREAKERDRASR